MLSLDSIERRPPSVWFEMLFRSRSPVPPLDTCIESLTLVRDPMYPYERERLFPDGVIDLLINLGEHEHCATLPGESRPRSYRRAWLSGARRTPLVIHRARHGYHLLVVRFRAGGAAAFFDFNLADITDRVVELDKIWGHVEVDRILDRLHQAVDAEAVLAVLERVLLQRHRPTEPIALVRDALGLLNAADLTITVRDVATHVGLSQTQLLRAFERNVGLSPKLLQRIARFQRVIALEAAHPLMPWTAIAHRCGYCDQAHLNRDFREFAECTPGTYRAGRGAYPNYLPIE